MDAITPKENPQETEAWRTSRIGKVGASRVADIIAKTKSGYGSSRANYMAELVAERLTGVQAESFTSAAIQWGIEKEPEARLAYEFRTNASVTLAASIPHPTIKMSGASPDGFVNDDGLVEIKSPLTATHLESLLGRSIPGRYQTQMLWQMACTGRKWCDFVSYDPRLPESMRLFIARMNRDDAMIAELESQVRAFLAELDAKVKALTAIYGGTPVVP